MKPVEDETKHDNFFQDMQAWFPARQAVGHSAIET